MKVDGIAKPPTESTARVDYEHEHRFAEHEFEEREFEEREEPKLPSVSLR